MIAIAKTVSTAVSKGIRIIKSIVIGNIARDAYAATPYGIDSNPIKNMDAIYLSTSNNNQPAIVGYLNKSQLAAVGEMRAFSTNADGAVKFNIWQRADGTALIGDSVTPADYTNFLVKFNELKTGFDTLRSEVNALVTAYNAHTHLYIPPLVPAPVTPIPTATALPAGVVATATIDASKATTIKTN